MNTAPTTTTHRKCTNARTYSSLKSKNYVRINLLPHLAFFSPYISFFSTLISFFSFLNYESTSLSSYYPPSPTPEFFKYLCTHEYFTILDPFLVNIVKRRYNCQNRRRFYSLPTCGAKSIARSDQTNICLRPSLRRCIFAHTIFEQKNTRTDAVPSGLFILSPAFILLNAHKKKKKKWLSKRTTMTTPRLSPNDDQRQHLSFYLRSNFPT